MNNEFKLDTRLSDDCFVLGKLKLSFLLLMNNTLVPWFILVPETAEVEITDLSKTNQDILLNEINLVSNIIKNYPNISKLNIAAIGNIVSQLHVHIVGRDPSDFCWPDVVWGTQEKKLYTDEQIVEITTTIKKQLGGEFLSNY